MMLAPPIQHMAEIDLADANRLLLSWEHRMGPCNRPNGDIHAHAMFVHGEPVAVTVTAGLMAETSAGLTRSQAVELARLCAGRAHMNRIMLRLWRELVLPCFRPHGWGISYQDEVLHTGATYRLDGWVALARSRTGTDSRTGRRGRNKTIWGWHPDAAVRAAHRMPALGVAA